MITCPQCMTYAEMRGPRILAEIRKSTSDELEVGVRWKRFLAGYHELHGVDPSRLLGRYVALMAAVGVSGDVEGSAALSAPRSDRATPSRSARPPKGRPDRRHGGKG